MFFKINIIILGFLITLNAYAQINNGLWVNDCNKGLKKEQFYSLNKQVILTESFFQDSSCADISFKFQTSGEVTYHDEFTQNIDFIYRELQLTVFKQNVINDFNARSVCGFNTWKQNEAKNITGLKCALFNINKPSQIPKNGDLKFGIYKIENNILYYGENTLLLNGSTPEKRPIIFNLTTEYIFQNSL